MLCNGRRRRVESCVTEVTEEGGGSGKRQTWRYVTGE